MKVCLICVELFAWGKYGGFGRITRLIGKELVKRGIEVCVVVPRRRGQKNIEILDGMTVLSFPMGYPFRQYTLFQECNADIYHSQEASFGTYIAQKAMPRKKHVVTFHDPKDAEDWKHEFSLPSLNKFQVAATYLYENNFFVKSVVRRLDAVCASSQYVIAKAKSIFSLSNDVRLLPSTPTLPAQTIVKATRPAVCYYARWDKRKRPELFFELAKRFPKVNFIAAGKSRNQKWDAELRARYGGLPNVEMVGFIDQFNSHEVSDMLGNSWILVHTAIREGLPNAFIEAASRKCAILSFVDPDRFATNFGYHAKDEDFHKGLTYLLESNRWKACGERGYNYVKNTYDIDRVIDMHLALYGELNGDE